MRGPKDRRVQEMNQEREMERQMRQLSLRGGQMDRDGYINGGPRRRRNYSATPQQQQVMAEQQQMEQRFNGGRRNGGYGMDRQPGEGGGMAHPMRRRGMPRELDNVYREERMHDEQGEAHFYRRDGHAPGHGGVVDPMYHRGGVGPVRPRLLGGGPRCMHPMQSEHYRSEYMERRDGGMDPAFYDDRMELPRWARR